MNTEKQINVVKPLLSLCLVFTLFLRRESTAQFPVSNLCLLKIKNVLRRTSKTKVFLYAHIYLFFPFLKTFTVMHKE